MGNPAFIDARAKIHWRKHGTWTTFDNSCAYSVAFGGDGSFYQINCSYDTYKYYDGSWTKFGDKKARSLSADREGTPWIVEHAKTK